jgi:RNA polymerase sigma factor (sigma-70 family)
MAKTNFLLHEDAKLILACRQGDAEAWAALVRRYQRLIYAIPRRAGLDEDGCADIFQHTFLTLYQHLDQLEQPERVRSWLVTTARRTTERAKQRMARWQPLPQAIDSADETTSQEWPDPAPLPDEIITLLEEQHLVRTAVAALEERCRQLLTLLFYDPNQPAYKEIAIQIGIPANSIGATRARCLQKLRTLLQDSGLWCIFVLIACSV